MHSDLKKLLDKLWHLNGLEQDFVSDHFAHLLDQTWEIVYSGNALS